MSVYDALEYHWAVTECLLYSTPTEPLGMDDDLRAQTKRLGRVMATAGVYALEPEVHTLLDFALLKFPGGPPSRSEAPAPFGMVYLHEPKTVTVNEARVDLMKPWDSSDAPVASITLRALAWLIEPTEWMLVVGFEGGNAERMVTWRLQPTSELAPRGILNWLRVFWAFVQQEVIVSAPAHISRPVRRQAERQGKPVGGLRVVTLRRVHTHRPVTPGEGVLWSHRWLVSGHWRRQPYRRLGIVQRIWIQPFVKGPPDKPLVPKVTVFDVAR